MHYGFWVLVLLLFVFGFFVCFFVFSETAGTQSLGNGDRDRNKSLHFSIPGD